MGLFWQNTPSIGATDFTSGTQFGSQSTAADASALQFGLGLGLGLSMGSNLNGDMFQGSNILSGNSMPIGNPMAMPSSTAMLMQSINSMMISVLQAINSFMMQLMTNAAQQKQSGGTQTTHNTHNGSNGLFQNSALGSLHNAGQTTDPESQNTHNSTKPIASGRNTDGSNVRATETLADYEKRFQVTNSGIWGDKAHQARKSDHNTGDAVDLGVKSLDQGQQVADSLLNEAEARGVKYIIFNHKIWSSERKDEGWRPYKGDNPHTGHVHVSFDA